MNLKRSDELLSKRRLTMLSASDENLVDEDLDNEEIIEGLTRTLNSEPELTMLSFSDDG